MNGEGGDGNSKGDKYNWGGHAHMYRRQPDPSESKSTDANVQGKFMLSMRWKIGKKVVNQGIVTAIVSTLTAIPEVDLA